jgi:hypothetical protein
MLCVEHCFPIIPHDFLALDFPQPHTQLLCVTEVAGGVVTITTGAGAASAQYSAAQLLQPPLISSVVPSVWSTTEVTRITITGDRWDSWEPG